MKREQHKDIDRVLIRTSFQLLVYALLDWLGLFNFASATAVTFGFILIWAWRDRE